MILASAGWWYQPSMTLEASEPSHWDAYAARFRLVGQPLRPGPSDVTHVRDTVRRLLPRDAGKRRALLLGVTTELAQIDWDPPLQLCAVDRSASMIRGVWPGDTEARQAQLGDWLSLPAPPGGFVLALGDGVLTLFDYPAGYAQLGSALKRLLAPQGLLCLRLFCRPEPSENVTEVFDALWAGRIGNFHVFKWRLAMAIQGDATRGVRLAKIWDTFEAHTSVSRLAERTGFPMPEVGTIEGYRGVQDRYSFSTEREAIDVLSPELELLETWHPGYELGERCPHLTFRRRP
jgi:SAM-dependent methyltransferase